MVPFSCEVEYTIPIYIKVYILQIHMTIIVFLYIIRTNVGIKKCENKFIIEGHVLQSLWIINVIKTFRFRLNIIFALLSTIL